jgi:peptidoglycan/LPS O-acetylase OafA/YrhL
VTAAHPDTRNQQSRPSHTESAEARSPRVEQSRAPLAALHIPALDGVRGLAILFVLAYHCQSFAGPAGVAAIDRGWETLASWGWTGVNLFFVLSGFLITGILDDAKGAHGYFRTFYARRFLRIFPIYYVFLAFFFYIRPHLGSPATTPPVPSEQQFWLWTYLSNWAITFRGGWDAIPKDLDHFWSLAVEEQFYLLWPLLVLLLSRRRMMLVCLAAIVLASITRYELFIHLYWEGGRVFTLACLDDLALGGLLALLAREGEGLAQWRKFALPAAITSIIALLLLTQMQSFSPLGLVSYAVQPTTRTVLFGSLLLAAVTLPRTHPLTRMLAAAPLRTLGKYSYAMYIIHQPLILALVRASYAPWRIPTQPGHSVLHAQLGYFLFITLLTLAIARITWLVIEQPCLELKRYFPYRWPTVRALPTDAIPQESIAATR